MDARSRHLEPARLVDRLHRFWFESVDLGPFVLARTLYGIVVVYWGLSLLPSVSDFFGPDGIDPDPPLAWWQISLLRYLPESIGPWIVVFALIGCGVLLAAGRLTRIAGPLTWLIVTSLYHDNRIIWNGGDDLLRLISLYIGLFCLVGPAARVDLPLFVRRDGGQRVVAPTAQGSVWVLRLLRIQLVVIYLSTLFEKLRGGTWADGSASARALQLSNMARFPIPDSFRSDPYLNNVVTWSSLALELALPILLLRRSTRRLAIVVGVGFHLVIEYAMRVGVFSWAMIACYLAFLSAEDARSLRLWIGNRHPIAFLRRWVAERRAGTPDESPRESSDESSDDAGDVVVEPGAQVARPSRPARPRPVAAELQRTAPDTPNRSTPRPEQGDH